MYLSWVSSELIANQICWNLPGHVLTAHLSDILMTLDCAGVLKVYHYPVQAAAAKFN